MIARSEVQEVSLNKLMSKYWKGQAQRVIFKLKVGMPKGVDSFLYDNEQENKIFVNLVNPLLQKIVAQAGNEALKLLGLSDSFDFIEEVIYQMEKYNMILADGINTTTREALKRALMLGISEHESVADLSKRVLSVYDEADATRAATIARSETIRANNYGAVEAYKQSGVVEYKEWMAALDERTCEFCLQMEQKYTQVSLDSPFLNNGDTLVGLDGGEMVLNYDNLDAPPLHPNCRCTILPVVKLTGQD